MSLTDALSPLYKVIDAIQTRLNDSKYASVLVHDFGQQLVSVRSAVEQAQDIRSSASLGAKDVRAIDSAIGHLYRTLRSASAAVARLPTESSPFKWWFYGSDIKDELLRQSVRLDQQLNQLGTLTNQAAIKAQLPPPTIDPVDVDAQLEARKALAAREDAEDPGAEAEAEDPERQQQVITVNRQLQAFAGDHSDALVAARQTMTTRRVVFEALQRMPRLEFAFSALDNRLQDLQSRREAAADKLRRWQQELAGARAGLATLQSNPELWEINKNSVDAREYAERIERAQGQVAQWTKKLGDFDANLRNPFVLLPAWDDDENPRQMMVTLEETLAEARECGAIIDVDTWSGGRGSGLVQEKSRRLQLALDAADAAVVEHLQYLISATGGSAGVVYAEVVRAVREGTEGLKDAVTRTDADVNLVLAAAKDTAKQLQPHRTDELPMPEDITGGDGAVLPPEAPAAAAGASADNGLEMCEEDDDL